MTQNEQNFINKINEMQNIIEWQKKAISERDDKIEELEELQKILEFYNFEYAWANIFTQNAQK